MRLSSNADKTSKVYCIIPARFGSKRIPRKNIALISGRPLISITISNLISSNLFEDIIVSSDSDEIINIAKKAGANLSISRPTNLSQDFTPTLDVIKHSLYELANISANDLVVCVYPTSALVTPSVYKNAITQYRKDELLGNFLISAARYLHSPQRAFMVSQDLTISPLYERKMHARTQDLPLLYHDAGQFYIANRSTWLNSTSVFTRAFAYILPPYSSLDIDTLDDLIELEKRLQKKM